MTQLLEKAFAEAARLPEKDQDAVAAFLLDEIKSEKLWSDLFARSQDQLAAMADEAIKEFEAGETRPLDLT